MELFSSDDEDGQMEFWNNWSPPSTKTFDRVISKSPQEKKPLNYSKTETTNLQTLFAQSSKLGNWIPPAFYFRSPLKIEQNLPKTKLFHGAVDNIDVRVNTQRVLDNREEISCCRTPWIKEVNPDWGKRRELHDMTDFSDGDFLWGVVQAGVFAKINLWMNEYDNICCLASGEISKIGSSEMTFISITNAQLLRKVLSVSPAQWASLCEYVQETKTALKFDAFQENELGKKTSLEKLWFFLCRRRHFLPRQCILVKFCGAVKCLRKLKITPKLLVQDVRTILGEPIL